jgi:hypothetical protein
MVHKKVHNKVGFHVKKRGRTNRKEKETTFSSRNIARSDCGGVKGRLSVANFGSVVIPGEAF